MEHYWGKDAIMKRVGLRSPAALYRYIRKYRLPCFVRVHPSSPTRRILFASEAMILAWELSMGFQEQPPENLR